MALPQWIGLWNNAPWTWKGCAIPIDVICQTSVVPSFVSISMRPISNGFPFIPMREAISACRPASGRVAHKPLLRMSCRRRTAEAGLTGAGSVKRVGNSLTTDLPVVVGSNRITGT